jgi:hypothetical protein
VDDEFFVRPAPAPDPHAPLVPPLDREQVEQLDVAALLGPPTDPRPRVLRPVFAPPTKALRRVRMVLGALALLAALMAFVMVVLVLRAIGGFFDSLPW